jgi:hypothetical protein
VGPTLWFFVFYSFEKLFAESLKVLMANHCRELELRLTTKSCLSAELCRELFAGDYSRQTLCCELTTLFREEPTHNKEVVSNSA